jgi:hypothetical protein
MHENSTGMFTAIKSVHYLHIVATYTRVNTELIVLKVFSYFRIILYVYSIVVL